MMEWNGEGPPVRLVYKIVLNGASPPNNYLHVVLDPNKGNTLWQLCTINPGHSANYSNCNIVSTSLPLKRLTPCSCNKRSARLCFWFKGTSNYPRQARTEGLDTFPQQHGKWMEETRYPVRYIRWDAGHHWSKPSTKRTKLSLRNAKDMAETERWSSLG